MIGPEGYLHRWTAPRKKFIQRTGKINGTSKSLVERLVDCKIFALSVLGYLGSTSAPDGATLKEEAHAFQGTTAGPYNLYLLTSHVLDLRAALVSTYLGCVSSALLPGLERLPTRTHSPTALQKSVQLDNTTVLRFSPLHLNGKNSFYRHRWLIAPWRPLNIQVIRIMLAELLTLPAIRN